MTDKSDQKPKRTYSLRGHREVQFIENSRIVSVTWATRKERAHLLNRMIEADGEVDELESRLIARLAQGD